MIELADLSSLRPATYNPRSVSKERLDLVALSLQKLGWLLPVYAMKSGEIISGHQRCLMAESLGYRQAPVVWLDDLSDAERKALNIVFNQATNDCRLADSTGDLAAKLAETPIEELASSLPDLRDSFRCVDAEDVSPGALLEANRGRWSPYAKQVALSLWGRGIIQPVVASEGGRVVNGIGRLQLAAEKKTALRVVWVDAAEAKLAEAMLNLLSMDFALEDHLGDFLRHNSFRRSRSVRKEPGFGFMVFAFPKLAKIGESPIRDPRNLRQWVAKHGRSVVDFGSGHGHETAMFRELGIRVASFEPYPLKSETIDKDRAISTTREFIQQVAETPFSSVFCSSVFNSIPFRRDREHVTAILGALAYPKGRVYLGTMSQGHGNWVDMRREQVNERKAQRRHIRLSYEGGVYVSDIARAPKVQKFHSAEDVENLIRGRFSRFRVRNVGGSFSSWAIEAWNPVICPAELRAAIEFEFDLPYPDGSTMNLVNDALDAFSQRLGIRL